MTNSQLTRGQESRIMYVELKTGYADKGPAFISRLTFSKSGKSVYFHGKELRRSRGRAIQGNYFDIETGEEYWVSGVKKDGRDRHWAGSGQVQIDEDAREEYLAIIK